MTVQELHTMFKVLLDKVDTQSMPDFQKAEIDMFLNLAQERIVKKTYGLNNLYQKGFEQSQKRIDDLRTVHVTGYKVVSPIEDTTSSISLNGFFKDSALTLTDNSEYWFLTNLTLKIKNKNCSDTINITPTYNKIKDNTVSDPFNKPKGIDCGYTFENNEIYIHHSDNIEIVYAKISFIKKPNKISYNTNTTSILPDHLHVDVVYVATQIALETIESQRIQTNQENINNLE